jgi:hypothetical protein
MIIGGHRAAANSGELSKGHRILVAVRGAVRGRREYSKPLRPFVAGWQGSHADGILLCAEYSVQSIALLAIQHFILW